MRNTLRFRITLPGVEHPAEVAVQAQERDIHDKDGKLVETRIFFSGGQKREFVLPLEGTPLEVLNQLLAGTFEVLDTDEGDVVLVPGTPHISEQRTLKSGRTTGGNPTNTWSATVTIDGKPMNARVTFTHTAKPWRLDTKATNVAAGSADPVQKGTEVTGFQAA